MSKSTILHNSFFLENSILKLFGILSTNRSSFWYKLYGYLVIFFTTLLPIMVIKDLITLEFNNALPSWFCFIGHLAITPPIAVYVFHRTKINNILERFEQEPFLPSDEKVDDTIKLLLLKWYNLKNKKVVVYVGSIVASVLSQTVYTLFLRLTRTDPNDWKMGYGELLDITYSPNFEIVFVYETITVIYSTTIASTITVIIVGVLDYITTQFKILQHNLQMILTTAKESLKQGANVNEISLKFLEEEIKRCVVYHISITNILKEVEDIFTYGIFFIFLSSQSMICIDIYRASILSVQDLRTYRFFVEIMAVSIGLFLINMAGEKMTYECEQIGNATYEINFLGTDTRFQKSLILIMRQSQKSVRIKAGKFIDISLMSFAKMLKASYSIYAVLKRTNENVV